MVFIFLTFLALSIMCGVFAFIAVSTPEPKTWTASIGVACALSGVWFGICAYDTVQYDRALEVFEQTKPAAPAEVRK